MELLDQRVHTYIHSFVTYYLTTIFEERRTSRSKQNIHGPNASVGITTWRLKCLHLIKLKYNVFKAHSKDGKNTFHLVFLEDEFR